MRRRPALGRGDTMDCPRVRAVFACRGCEQQQRAQQRGQPAVSAGCWIGSCRRLGARKEAATIPCSRCPSAQGGGGGGSPPATGSVALPCGGRRRVSHVPTPPLLHSPTDVPCPAVARCTHLLSSSPPHPPPATSATGFTLWLAVLSPPTVGVHRRSRRRRRAGGRRATSARLFFINASGPQRWSPLPPGPSNARRGQPLCGGLRKPSLSGGQDKSRSRRVGRLVAWDALFTPLSFLSASPLVGGGRSPPLRNTHAVAAAAAAAVPVQRRHVQHHRRGGGAAHEGATTLDAVTGHSRPTC